jgi:hypothetical protein
LGKNLFEYLKEKPITKHLKIKMKKALFLLVLSLIISSCKSSSHVKCDAYGSVDNIEFDIEKSNIERQKKYVTTVSIKM